MNNSIQNLVTEIVTVTPDMAAEMLEKNTLNRNLSYSVVSKYAQVMKYGRWKTNGSTIVFAEDGTLLDGQHRLWAVIEANRPVQFLIVRNAEKDSILTLDTGKTRNSQNILQMEKSKHSGTAAMLTKLLWIHDLMDCNLKPESCQKNVDHTSLRNYYQENRELVEQAADLAEHGNHHFVKSYMALAFCIIGRKTKHKDKIDEFFHILKTGENINMRHPLMTLRTRLTENRMNSHKYSVQETIACYIRVWNAFIRNRSLTTIRWNANEEMPEVL